MSGSAGLSCAWTGSIANLICKLRSISDDDGERVIVKSLEEKPANVAHWSTRSMASATGTSRSAPRASPAFDFKSHRVESFKVSWDSQIQSARLSAVSCQAEGLQRLV